MSHHLDQNDLRLLDLIQAEIPVVARPFHVLATKLGIGEDEVVVRLMAMKSGKSPVIRQISGIFDSYALGYQSTLVAARVAEEQLDDAAATINQHPGVSHNYCRNHAFNLWYTLTLPPDSTLGLEKTVEILHEFSGAESTRMFPTIRLYKIGVRFDLSGETSAPPLGQRGKSEAAVLSLADKRNIRILQRDLPITSRPFDLWADEAKMTTQSLLDAIVRYQRQGTMRRFAAVLHHREVGVAANVMGAWAVPWEMCDTFGAIAADYPQVSHCYHRPTYSDWPYSVFTMIHGTDLGKCRDVLRLISLQTGIDRYAALLSTRQYKKIRVAYFTPSIGAWEQRFSKAATECEEVVHSA